jgi:KaiC/GvpD/RAD55 family RecA-like ATPase
MSSSNGFSTGIRLLDREIDGGLPPGSILLFTAPAASQSEQFLYRFSQPRETLYSTTVRSKHSVIDAIKRTPKNINTPSVEDHTDSPVNQIQKAVGRLEEESTLIVDTIDPLEENNKSEYMYFINYIQDEIVNTESVVILHAMKSDTSSENRVLTKQMADVVFDLNQTEENGNVLTTLSIPKYRGGTIPEETIKLDLTEGITIDPSRDIS